ncbi:MAG TPA: hypothetical protein P5560_13545, partial [Thermotogota bacterium]|nr:hypothetical protein [Thermotogota bacterium]
FVGRKKEFDYFLGDWYFYLKNNMAQSQALLARRKKGKTAFLQRLFNILWSQPEGGVIPFYFSIPESKTPLGHFSKVFFSTFANQYLSFTTRKTDLAAGTMDFKKLERNVVDPFLRDKYNEMVAFEEANDWYSMWRTASWAPFFMAINGGVKIVQILDEFQNIDRYVTDERGAVIDSMSGTYLDLAEMKEAPLIVSGSEVHGLLRIIRGLTDRFGEYTLENLPEAEARQAIAVYAKSSRTRINEGAIERIWNLTRGDPLYIKALFLSRYNSTKDYTDEDNIISTYTQETTRGEIFKTWKEYIAKVFYEVNEVNAKRIMLYLFQAAEERTRAQIRKDLKLDISDFQLEGKLQQLVRADLISGGETSYDYQISPDKTYELVFRQHYQKEIEDFVPDIRAEIRKQMGKTSYEKGKFREFLLKEKLKKPFNLQHITQNGPDRQVKPRSIVERKTVRLGMTDREIDLIVEGKPEVWVDVKDTQRKYGKPEADRWIAIMQAAREQRGEIVFLVYSQAGFTKGTKERLLENGAFLVS